MAYAIKEALGFFACTAGGVALAYGIAIIGA